MPRRVVNGIRLYYEKHGEGDPILCIHGGGSSAVMWEEALEELARRGRVIIYDRRGCTRSERPEPYERTSVAEQADDAAALLDALAAAPAVVIGRSYGGALAIDLALRYPERVRALVLLEGDALGVSPAGLQWTKGLRDRLRKVAARDGVDAVYEALIGEVIGQGAWSSFADQVRRILAHNGPALLAELGYVDEPMPDAAAFATIDKPALLVAASQSPPEQRDMTDAMAAMLPNARTALVGGGHLIDPAAPEVLAFLEEVLEPAEWEPTSSAPSRARSGTYGPDSAHLNRVPRQTPADPVSGSCPPRASLCEIDRINAQDALAAAIDPGPPQ